MAARAKYADYLIRKSRVLVVDDSQFMRSIVRGLLTTIGVKEIFEASDGIGALEKIRENSPDVLVLDWEMPLLNGPELVRIVRSPGVFPMPDIPIIILSGHGERKKILEAVKLGVNEFLCKPVSAKSLRDRMVSILLRPRPNVWRGAHYGPEPRVLPSEPSMLMPESESPLAAQRAAAPAEEPALRPAAAPAPILQPARGDSGDVLDIDTLTAVRL
ncbi:MAG TPA: response regulator [Pseudolabrys sp.]|nr:response regulator [Pseudolabrys sp.]